MRNLLVHPKFTDWVIVPQECTISVLDAQKTPYKEAILRGSSLRNGRVTERDGRQGKPDYESFK